MTYTADQLEAIFHAAIKAGDAKGVHAALRVMVTVDPHRAADLYDTLDLALKIAKLNREAAP